MNELTHLDEQGKARMVDIGHKPDQIRIAIAQGFIRLLPGTVQLIRDNLVKKGDVLAVAEIAGIQAAKQTPTLIPLCHPIGLTSVQVSTQLTGEGVQVTAEARCTGPTGVEMEALTAVSTALLTVYDMCKAVDKQMAITDIHLSEKIKQDVPR